MRSLRCLGLTVAAIAVIAGCGTSDGNTIAPKIDVAALDSGNFPTEPRDIEVTPETGNYLEAIRIADVTPLVVDIDPRYSHQRMEIGRAHV